MEKKADLMPSKESLVLSKTTSQEMTRIQEIENNEAAITAVATKARAEVESQLIMARKFPRNEDDIRTKVLKTCRIYSFAEKAKYKKPQGKKYNESTRSYEQQFVIGPSIRLAEELFRQWGNSTMEMMVLYENAKVRIVNCKAMDLQTLAISTGQFLIEKTVERKDAKFREVISERMNSNNEKISLVVATEDEVFSKQNQIGSKYRRNLIMQLMPVWLVSEAIAMIDETIKAGIKENPDKAKLDMIDTFAKIGILPSDLEKYIGHPMAQINADEILELKDLCTAIGEGEATWAEALEEKLKPAEVEPKSQGSFKAGDEKTHSSVQAPITDIGKLRLEIEVFVKKLGKEKVDKVIDSYGFAKIDDIVSPQVANKIVCELQLV